MLDPKFIRQELDQVAQRLLVKGFDLDIVSIQSLEDRRKSLQLQTEELQALRNAQSKAIGKAKSEGKDAQALLDEVSDIGDQLDRKKQELAEVQARLNEFLMAIPNLQTPQFLRVRRKKITS